MLKLHNHQFNQGRSKLRQPTKALASQGSQVHVIPITFLTHASDILGDTDNGLSGNNIVRSFVGYAVDFNVDIPHNTCPFDAPNKRTALFENLVCFTPEQQFQIIRELCDHPKLPSPTDESISNLKIQTIARYSKLFGSTSSESLNQTLVEETKHWLDDYKKSKKLYESALTKYQIKIFERNLLDDLRLSLEVLLKKLFSNSKSLEKQISSVGRFVSDNGGSKHFTNMFQTLVSYYSKYQNSFVKHDDAVVEEEIEFVFEMTSSFMKHLVKMSARS